MPMAAILRSPAESSLLDECRVLHPRASARQVAAAKATQTPVSPADAPSRHAKLAAKPDERLFHQAHKIDRAKARAPPGDPSVAQAAQIEDRVADELPRPVIGHVAAAIDLVESDAARGQQLIGRREC